MYPWTKILRFNKAYIVFISTVRRLKLSLCDRQKALDMTDNETSTREDAQH